MDLAIKLLSTLKEQLQQIASTSDDILIISRESFNVAKDTLLTLKSFISTYNFRDTAEEVLFFKELKPQFYALLIYHAQVYDIEIHKPVGTVKAIRRYLKSHLSTIIQFYHDNQDFYKYIRSGSSYLDEVYFVRGKYDLAIGLDTAYFFSDPEFSTSSDHKLSKLLANEQLVNYLNNALKKLKGKKQKQSWLEESMLGWSESKVALIELIYGLQSAGVFYNKKDNSRADVRQVATFFEKLFDIDLGNYYRTFQEIRIRKDRTSFLNRIKEQLLKRMDDSDEKNNVQI